MVTVLGVDPGLTRCGVGVVRGPSSRMQMIAHDCVRTSADTSIELRLLAHVAGIEALRQAFRDG